MIGSFKTYIKLEYKDVINLNIALLGIIHGLHSEGKSADKYERIYEKIREQLNEFEDQIGAIEDYAIEMYNR